MATMKITKYICDVCKEEMEKTDMETISIPCYGEGTYHTHTNLDLCPRCSSMLRKAIYDNFAEIRDCYGIFIKKKYKDEDYK